MQQPLGLKNEIRAEAEAPKAAAPEVGFTGQSGPMLKCPTLQQKCIKHFDIWCCLVFNHTKTHLSNFKPVLMQVRISIPFNITTLYEGTLLTKLASNRWQLLLTACSC